MQVLMPVVQIGIQMDRYFVTPSHALRGTFQRSSEAERVTARLWRRVLEKALCAGAATQHAHVRVCGAERGRAVPID